MVPLVLAWNNHYIVISLDSVKIDVAINEWFGVILWYDSKF